MYDGADYDNWDTHRDMILRDRVIHNKLLSFTEMNTFGKSGIGNESTYNAGYALCRYIAVKYGPEKLKMIMDELSNPFQMSINIAIRNATGIGGKELYNDFKLVLEERYDLLTTSVRENEFNGNILISDIQHFNGFPFYIIKCMQRIFRNLLNLLMGFNPFKMGK